MKKSVKIPVILLAVLMLLTAVPFAANASEEYAISSFDYDYKVYDPIPLIVIVISFDADGDGRDAYLSGLSTTDSSLPSYGEQWSYSDESYWGDALFGKMGKTMYNYFSVMSDGKFYFTPVEETYGVQNNGVVYVTVNCKHPNAVKGTNQSAIGNERVYAVQEAAKYVDFASYDKNGDGNLSFTELSFAFIIAGYNSKWGTSSKSAKLAWGENCFQTSGRTKYTADGVTFAEKFIYMGEFMRADTPIRFGTIAHELGHVLGAKDLYTYSGYTWCGGPGEVALQGGGSSIAREGELAGLSPSAIDPYYLTFYGFKKAQTVTDGEYTLYSRESAEHAYEIIRINTYDPDEYYLIENRYTVQPTSFDGIDPGAHGIMIWHIDEGIIRGFTLPNCYKGAAHAPGLTPLYPNGNTGGGVYNAWDISDGTFDCTKFKFAGADTWSTCMTEEDMAKYNLKIEMLSEPGVAMKIKVTGAVDLGPYLTVVASEKTTESIKVAGKITDLNNGTLTGLKCYISDKKDFSNIISSFDLKPDNKGEYSCEFTGLSPSKGYYVRTEAISDKGVGTATTNTYTSSLPKVRTEDYVITFYRNLDTFSRPYDVTVKLGQTVKYNFPMERDEYTFGGWYTDEELTQKYDISTVKYDCEPVTLYARWILNENAVSVKVVGYGTQYPLFACAVGETVDVPVLKGNTEVNGWYTDPQYTTPFDFGEQIYDSGVITLYPLIGEKPAETTSPNETTAAPETTAPAVTKEQTSAPADTSGDGTTATGETTEPVRENSFPVVPVVIVVCVIVAAGGVFLIIRKKKQ